MTNPSTESNQTERVRLACSALDELQDETRRLVESIEAQSLRTRAKAGKARKLSLKSARSKR